MKPGDRVHAIIPFSPTKPMCCTIMYVLDSCYEGRKLIVYRVYGKHKQWWHEFMASGDDFEYYKERAKAYNKKS